MAEVKQTCANCRWAKFGMTKHATPRPQGPGRCEWPVPVVALPLSITAGTLSNGSRFHKQSIWPDYADCPTWESAAYDSIQPSTKFDPTTLHGVRFFNEDSQRDMRYIYPDVDHWLAGWIVVKNPSGDWMALRKATDSDIAAISGAVVNAHHR